MYYAAQTKQWPPVMASLFMELISTVPHNNERGERKEEERGHANNCREFSRIYLSANTKTSPQIVPVYKNTYLINDPSFHHSYQNE